MTGKRIQHIHPTRRRFLTGALRAAAMAAGVVAAITSSAVSAQDQTFPRSTLAIETQKGRFDFSVELADTAARRIQGLQHRGVMAADAGMLFDYKQVKPVSMWMKNTVLPLDMLFIDETGVIVRIAQNTVPFSLTVIESGRPVRAVLEVNAGTVERLGISPGDRVHHAIFGASAK